MFKSFSFLDIAKAMFVLYLIYFFTTVVPTMFSEYINSKGADKTTIEQIAKNVSRAVVDESNAKVNDIIKDLRAQNSVAIKAVEDLGDKVSGIGVIVGSFNPNIEEEVAGDYFEDVDGLRDLHDFLVYSGLETEDGSKMPIATVYYSPEQEDREKRVTTNSHKIEFKANVIEAISKDGKPSRTVEAWAENSYSTVSKGKKYPIDLYISDWAIKKPPKSFMWNPNLNLSMLAEVDSFFPGLGVSLCSYGKTKKDVDWRFVNVFVGAANDYNDVMVGVIPVSYNVANHLPLVSNIFVGPFIGTDFKEEIYGLGVSVPF